MILLNRYRGERLDRKQGSLKKQRLMRDVIISTVYDKPVEVPSTILRHAPPTTLKHRSVVFKEGGLLNQNTASDNVEPKLNPKDTERTA